MKKILFVSAVVILLAAGCHKSQPVESPAPNSAQPAPYSSPRSQAEDQATANANVNVNNADDAVNLLETNSSSEQSLAAGGTDSDLASSDSAELKSFTEVPNGY